MERLDGTLSQVLYGKRVSSSYIRKPDNQELSDRLMLKDLTPTQAELEHYMSGLSEEAYYAGWMLGLEYALWEVVLRERREYGTLVLSQEHRTHLRHLSEACGGWIVFDDETEETWIPRMEWEQRFSAWRRHHDRDGSGE